MREKPSVFVGRRNGVIVATWSARPTMMDVPAELRTQDADLVFEVQPHDHPEVAAFTARPLPQAVDRLARLEAEIAELKKNRATPSTDAPKE